MSTKASTLLAVAAGAFLGGLAAGLLLSPRTGRENRDYLRKKSQEWSQRAGKKGREMKTKIRDTVPDLYEATAQFGLEEEDLKGSRL